MEKNKNQKKRHRKHQITHLGELVFFYETL